LIDSDNPLSVWAIGCGDRIVWALATSVNPPQERLDIIRQVDDGPRVSLLSRAPLLPLGRGRLQPEWRRAGLGGSTGMRGALRLTSFRIKQIAMSISNGTKAISPSAIRSWGVMLIQ
jgi:hypothetical protein